MIAIAILIVLFAIVVPRSKRCRRGDRHHFIIIAIRERYNAELAQKIAGQL
jgi:hypothetical protein